MIVLASKHAAHRVALPFAFAAVFAGGCDRASGPDGPAGTPTAIGAAPGAAGSPAPTGPPAMEPASGTLTGEVAERLAAGSYTYVRVVDRDGESRWVVTLGGAEPPGARVRVTRIGARRGFHSARLDRTFDHLLFGIVRAE